MFLKHKSYATTKVKSIASSKENSLYSVGSDKSQKIDRIKLVKDEIQNILLAADNTPMYTFEDIKSHIKYIEDIGILNLNCHIGQRKLLLNEIQFYSRYLKKDHINLVIYAGSAHGEHTPTIVSMYPEIKLLMIDPNFHNMDIDYTYIYQNTKVISKDNINEFLGFIRKKGNSQRDKKLLIGANRLKNIKFMFSDLESIDVASTFPEKMGLLRGVDVLESGVKDIDEIKKQYDDFPDNAKHMIKNIINDENKVFVIQDYATSDLMLKIRESIDYLISEDADKSKLNILFISDIRTNMFKSSPIDVDIIWNNIQQLAFARILLPSASMFKFHPPYACDTDEINKLITDISDTSNTSSDNKTYNYIVDDIKKLSKYYDINNIIDEKNKQYKYIQGVSIYLQPWAPLASSETRLIVTEDLIDRQFIEYSCEKWSDKFFYLRFYRMFSYFSGYIDKLYDHSLQFDYDGCFDCNIEIQIISEYLSRNEDISSINYKDIENKLNSKDFCVKILDIYNNINKSTYYELKKNFKCPFHGRLTEKPNSIYLYNVSLDDEKFLNQTKITKDSIETEQKYKIEELDSRVTLYPYQKFMKLTDKKETHINNIINLTKIKLKRHPNN